MEVNTLKIYDIQLVIDRIEVDGNTSKVLSVECCGSRMFLGTAEGNLLEYFITDERSKTFFSRVRSVNLNKGQPIIQIRNASALDTLITLTGGTMSMWNNQTLEPKSNSISAVTCFAVDENPMDGDPFIVSLCFAKKKTITVAQASEKGFQSIKEISLDAMPISLAIEAGLCCLALATGRYVFVDTMAQRKSVQDLCEFDPKEVMPKVVHVGKEEFLVIGPGGLGVFTTSRGTSERPPIIWSEKVHQLAVDGLNIVAVGSEGIYVSSLSDPGTSNLIPFPGAKCLAVSEGKLYVGTTRSLYRFIPISVDDQVESLLSSDKIEQAFSLLEMANIKSDRKEFLYRKIHRRAVFHRMTEFELPLCKESIRVSNLDLREIISLFPGILPSTTVFTRSLPQLHDFMDIHQLTNKDSHKTRTLASFLLDVLTSYEPTNDSKDMSTSAIKLAAKYNKCKFILLLDYVNEMTIDYDDCFEWMNEHKMFDSAALLYKAKGDLSKALDTWISLLSKELDCGEDDEFEGIDVITETLLNCNDHKIVWTYYWKLAKIDKEKAIEIFTKRSPSPIFQPLEIAEKLSATDRPMCRVYLTHCVHVKKLDDEDLHTFLATLFIDEITALSNEQEQNELRVEFRTFLIESNSLKVQFLIGKLSNTQLRLELAILHGKAGDHAPALQIIVGDLQDHKFAREYCKKIQDADQRESAFIDLFKTYLNRSEGSAISDECINVLVDFAEEFNVSLLLPLLPDDLTISTLSTVLHRALRIKVHKERTATLVKGLSQRVHNNYHIAIDGQNQGYQLDDDSVCGVCWRKLDPHEPLMHNKGLVVHPKCV